MTAFDYAFQQDAFEVDPYPASAGFDEEAFDTTGFETEDFSLARLYVRGEMEFLGRGNGWTDVTEDLAGDVRLRYGISGVGPSDRVASTGTFNFAFDNSAKNAAKKLGYYSPNHANRRSGFKLGIGVRLVVIPQHSYVAINKSSAGNPTTIETAGPHGLTNGDTVSIISTSIPALNGEWTATVVDSTHFTVPVNTSINGVGGSSVRRNKYFKFSGTLDVVRPTAGLFTGDVMAHCTAVDWMNDAARLKVTGLPVKTNRRSDLLFQDLVASLSSPPLAIEADTGQDTYAYAFDNTRDESDAVLTEFQRLAASELGFIYIKGDRVRGGTLVYESRRRRALTTENVDTFTDVSTSIFGGGVNDLEAEHARQDVINKVQLTAHARRVDAAATTVLAKLQNSVSIGANSTITILQPYHDPNQQAARVGGTDMVVPVAATDYAMNTAADGSGSNITADFTVTANYGGNGVRWTITNNGSQNGFITLLQARGRGIYDYQNTVIEAIDDASKVAYGEGVASVDMTYQSDIAVATEAALYLVNLYKDPTTNVKNVNLFAPAHDVAFIDRMMRREISDRIGIFETVTGVKVATGSVGYFIQAVDLASDERNGMSCSWLLGPADKTAYWVLEVPGRTELDSTTVLGFGQIVGHTDVLHCDTHDDILHGDIAHADVTHLDVAHSDGGHQDVAHTDVVHSDSHGDTSHQDQAHQDQAHSDSHSDVSHQDTAHDDVAHTDNHGDVNHQDGPGHGDVNVHQDVPHGDSHSDVAHSDSHSDQSHQDASHQDVSHSDSHGDSLHQDVTHADQAHGDSAHDDVAHEDVNHSDGTHQDDHCDVAHGDI